LVISLVNNFIVASLVALLFLTPSKHGHRFWLGKVEIPLKIAIRYITRIFIGEYYLAWAGSMRTLKRHKKVNYFMHRGKSVRVLINEFQFNPK